MTRNTSKIIYIFAFIVLIASISRFPILDQIDEVKIGIFGAEIISLLLIAAMFGGRSSAITMMVTLGLLIWMRFIFGAFNANYLFNQSLGISAQEARFGVMLVACPLVYYFLKNTPVDTLKKFTLVYLLILIAMDIGLFALLATENLLILGVRTDNRFVCSILIPLVCTALISLRRDFENRHETFLMLSSLSMVFHTYLVTTSRIEMFLAIGVLLFVVQRSWPRSRWLLHTLLFAGTMYFLANIDIGGQGIAGRDFSLAFVTALRGLPWGYGMVIDATAKEILNLPAEFYFSDYGLLLYIMRYGAVGIFIAFALLLLWLKFLLVCLRIRGGVFVAAPTLVYVVFIPFLDYGSLVGGFFLAFMMVVINKKYVR